MPDSPPPQRRRSRSRSRSRSPPRQPKKSSTGGFRWKEKRRPERGEDDDAARRLDRGYRARDDRYRDRHRDSYQPRDRDDRDRPAEKPISTSTDDPARREKKEKKKKRPAIPSEPMILVHVNDRLGTKATVPCLPSDTVGDLKTLVAAQIGRAPREILLKRQGERPFKDFISLGDYGITNGVQLDLEIGTGD
ncbi:ubiquitin-like protein HUB1 [Aspergillus brunneoviolaceus CBS 621.78]|uniref:Ubiquitin-like protein n=1 Tax=Aspergillus brunneoviolaceus CBS 621.78 TaxID=1450534 RepID=A0ACD1GHN0_9EURO|nr:ubiquitin-like protein [Aspergillus brunneoviolaceus CBS 621.78]RAH48839.1 ubiquitin-like protein [Aspergillus brunneoviolaceus CBS 621.78]